jgi:hypothetical protein
MPKLRQAIPENCKDKDKHLAWNTENHPNAISFLSTHPTAHVNVMYSNQ